MTAVPKQIALVDQPSIEVKPAMMSHDEIETIKARRGPLFPKSVVQQCKIVRWVK